MDLIEAVTVIADDLDRRRWRPTSSPLKGKMHLRTITFALLLTTVLGGCASVPNVAPGRSEDDPMFQFVGMWEGTLDGFNGPHFVDGVGFSMSFRILIDRDDTARVFQLVKSEWKEMKPGFFSVLRWGSQAIVTSITSGNDEDGTWIEGSTFTLMHHDPDTVIAYWLRTVNNLDLPATAEYFHFAWGNSGKMRRVSGDEWTILQRPS